ncbi:unnamed protein product [Caenorhabditis brenneri]
MLKLFLISSLLWLPVLGQTFQCPPNYTKVLSKCLRVFPETTWGNHSAAEKICRKDGGTLVTIRSAIENRAVATFASGSGSNKIWIGTFCFGNDTSQCVYDDTSLPLSSYNGFQIGYPFKRNQDDGCVMMATQGSAIGLWTNGLCNQNEPIWPVCEVPGFVNYSPPPSSCINYDKYCYEKRFGTYDDAVKYCGGVFLSIHSRHENDFIQNNLIDSSHSQVLIGARRMFFERYIWEDGTIYDFDNRDPMDFNFENLECLAINKDTGLWMAIPCSTSLPYYCKFPNPGDPTVDNSHCNSTLLMAPVTITSYMYPYSFNGPPCSWKIGTGGAYRLRFSITDLSGSPLTVYDANSNVIGQPGGPQSLVAPSNYITVVQSGSSYFRAKVTPY